MCCVRYGLSVVVHIFPEIPDDGVDLFLGKGFEGRLSDSGLRHKLMNIAWCRRTGFLEAASDCVLCGWTYHGCRSSPSTTLRLACAVGANQPDSDCTSKQILTPFASALTSRNADEGFRAMAIAAGGDLVSRRSS